MPRTVKHELKADDLLLRGMEILWSKGYNGTSVNDIVKEAGIPKGSFYFYFQSKEDFAIKALRKYADMMFGPGSEILTNKEVSPRQRVIDFYAFRAKFLIEDLECQRGCLACNLGNEVGEHIESIRLEIARIHGEIKKDIIAAMDEAQKLGEIKSEVDVENLVSFMEDAGKGAMMSMKENSDATSINNFMTMLKEVLLK